MSRDSGGEGGLHIADGLSLPLDAVTETVAILARRGSGKTYGACVMAEEMIGAGAHAGVIDPLGVWWSRQRRPHDLEAGFMRRRTALRPMNPAFDDPPLPSRLGPRSAGRLSSRPGEFASHPQRLPRSGPS